MLPKWPVAEDRMKMTNERTCHRGRSGTIRSPAVPMAFLSLSYENIAPIAPSLVILSDSIDVRRDGCIVRSYGKVAADAIGVADACADDHVDDGAAALPH